jgi:hypothetical protein
MADRTVESEFGSRYEIPGFIIWLVKNRYLEDMSWHNDSAPSFGVTGDIKGTKGSSGGTSQGETRIFVEHPLQSFREFQGKRFGVMTAVDNSDHETWDFDELEEALEKLFEVIVSHWGDYETVPGVWSLLLDDAGGDPREALYMLKRKYYNS